MPTDLLALPSAGQPPSHCPPTCPAPSPICDLSPICPLHVSSHHRCPSVHPSYLPPSPSILPASCPPTHGPGHLTGASTPLPTSPRLVNHCHLRHPPHPHMATPTHAVPHPDPCQAPLPHHHPCPASPIPPTSTHPWMPPT